MFFWDMWQNGMMASALQLTLLRKDEEAALDIDNPRYNVDRHMLD